MNREVMLAQAGTLAEWAGLWQREEDEGCAELSYQLGRAARLIRLIAGELVAEEPEAPPSRAPVVAEVREG